MKHLHTTLASIIAAASIASFAHAEAAPANEEKVMEHKMHEEKAMDHKMHDEKKKKKGEKSDMYGSKEDTEASPVKQQSNS